MEWFTESVIIQIIATAGAILAALIPAYLGIRNKLNRVGDDAREAKEQTSNDHSDNLRDELDQRHNIIMDTLQELGHDIHGLRLDHMATRRDIGQLRGEDREARKLNEELRRDIQAHIDDTARYIPAFRQLMRAYKYWKQGHTASDDQDFLDDFNDRPR